MYDQMSQKPLMSSLQFPRKIKGIERLVLELPDSRPQYQHKGVGGHKDFAPLFTEAVTVTTQKLNAQCSQSPSESDDELKKWEELVAEYSLGFSVSFFSAISITCGCLLN